MVTIIPYTDEYQPIFREMNKRWLDQYELTESHDLEILDDPHGTIIRPGGAAFLAMEDGAVIGTAAIMVTEKAGIYELAKFAVVPSARGRGIGKLLLTRCLDEARKFSATRIILFSNHQLKEAINLYRGFGFQQVPVGQAPFVTADVKMELDL